MKFSRISFFAAVSCLWIVIGLLAAGCSDDDKATSPTSVKYEWSSVGGGSGYALAVYDNELIAAQSAVRT